MKKRPVLRIEQLEARETPDVSLGHPGAFAVPSLPNHAAVLNGQPVVPSPLAWTEQLQSVAQALPDPARRAEAASYLQALERLFNDSDIQRLVDGSADTLAAEASAPRSQPSSSKQLLGSDHAITEEQALRAWRFLYNYTNKAIRNEETKYGPLTDHEDIIHQTFVEWRQQVGEQNAPFTRVLDKTSPERQLLQKTVRRVIDHTRYEQNRQKKMAELIDHPTPSKPAHQDWIDIQLDWAQGVGNLVPQEIRLLQLRSQGKTFEEIGSEIGLVKQRVCEIYNSALDRLQSIYAS